MKPDIQLGPWPLGIDNVSGPTNLKADDKGRFIALSDAVNVDINRDGDIDSRAGSTLVQNIAGLHSLWSGATGAYGVAAGVLYRIAGGVGTPIGTLNSDDPCSYDDLNAETVLTNRTTLAVVSAGVLSPLGVPDAPQPSATAAMVGALDAGKYSVAISFLRGQVEGGLSLSTNLQIAQGQGIQLSNLPANEEATAIRVYRTAAGGTVFYRCTDLPIGMTSYLLGNDPLGAQAPNVRLTRMLPGSLVAVWHGRLLVARGRTLEVSEPFQYGLTSRRHGFVQVENPLTMMIGVTGGVYVGTSKGVQFLRGGKPDEWIREKLTKRPPVPGAFGLIDGGNLPTTYQLTGHLVAVWLSPSGFVLGSPDGQLIEPHSDRLVTGLGSAGTLIAHGRRVTATIR